jgi:hypothetical protein
MEVTPSPDGTIIYGPGETIVTDKGEIWALSAASGQVMYEGAIDGTTSNVVLLQLHEGKVYQSNVWGGWWYKEVSTDTWVSTTPPPATTGSLKTILQSGAVGLQDDLDTLKGNIDKLP